MAHKRAAWPLGCVLLALALALSGCGAEARQESRLALTPPEQPSPIPRVAARGAPQRAAGLFLSLSSASSDEDAEQFRLAAGEPFVGRLTLVNFTLYQRFQVVCLVDYQQTPCVENPIDLALGEERTFRVRLPPLSEGLHPLLVVVFFAPDEHPDDPIFRANSRYLLAYRRAWAQVGQPGAVVARAPVRLLSTRSREARQGFALFQLTPGRQTLDFDAPEWLVARSGPPVRLDYTVLITNPREESTDYLLLPFLDFLLQPQPEHNDLYLRVRRVAGGALPLTLETRLEPGEHEFQVLAVASPYADRQAMRGRALQATVNASARVLIHVAAE